MKIKVENESKKFNSLIKEIASGNQAALKSVYSEYGKLIYFVAISITKYSYIADEIVNDVLLKLWLQAPKLKNIKRPIGWLCTVTANCAKDRIKAEKSFSEIYDIPQDDKNIEEFLIREAFLSYISPLSEEEQQIIILYYGQHVTFKLIAKEINKPISTVSSTFYRAIEKLKKTLK